MRLTLLERRLAAAVGYMAMSGRNEDARRLAFRWTAWLERQTVVVTVPFGWDHV